MRHYQLVRIWHQLLHIFPPYSFQCCLTFLMTREQFWKNGDRRGHLTRFRMFMRSVRFISTFIPCWHTCSAQLAFQLTLRSISSSEIVQDPALVSRLKALYDRLDAATTPASILLPWLPTPAMIRKLWATKEVYGIISKVVRERAASGKPRNDTLQMLLDSGDEHLLIVGVCGVSWLTLTVIDKAV